MEWFWSDWTQESRVGETNDPLGLQSVAVAIADALLPGFSGGTTRARSLSLLLAGTALLSDPEHPPLDPGEYRNRFARFDRLCVHRVALGEAPRKWISVRGIRKAVDLRKNRHPNTAIDLKTPLNEATTGACWSYRRLAAQLGLLELGPGRHADRLTEAGRAIADAALATMKRARSTLRGVLDDGKVKRGVLAQIKIDRRPSDAEGRLIATALGSFTTAEDPYPLRALANVVDSNQQLGLSDRQRALLQSAVDVFELVESVEGRFRERVGLPKQPRINDYRAQYNKVRVLEERLGGLDGSSFSQALDTLRLIRDALDDRGSIAALEDHHRTLMAKRGRPPWDEPRPRRTGRSFAAWDVADEDDVPDEDDDDQQLLQDDGLPRTPTHDRVRALRRMAQDCGWEVSP